MKRTIQFTPHQLETWAVVLGCYPEATVVQALIEYGLNSDPFPEIGKVLEVCHRVQNENATQPTNFDPKKPGKGLVKRVLAAFALATTCTQANQA